MPKPSRWFHITLEVVGGLAIVGGLAWFTFHLPTLMLALAFKNFSGANCDDSEQQTITSQDGRHSLKSLRRVCGAGAERNFSHFTVYISTGNDNKGYEYAPIVSLRNIEPHQASVEWNNPDQLSVYYPPTADVDEAYARIFGVNIVLHPQPLSSAK